MKIIIVADDFGHRGGAGHIARVEYDLLHERYAGSMISIVPIVALIPAKSKIYSFFRILYVNVFLFILSLSPKNVFFVHNWSFVPFVSFIRPKQRFFIQHDYLLICPSKSLYNKRTGTICNLLGYSLTCMQEECGYSKSKKIYNKIFARKFLSSLNVRYLSSAGEARTKEYCKKSSVKIKKDFLLSNLATISEVDLQKFNKRDKLETGRVIYVGRYSYDKGYDRFLALKINKFTRVSCGAGAIAPNKEVKDLGWRNQDAYLREISNSDALFYPARQLDADPIIVKMSCVIGVPVFISDGNAASGLVKKVFGEAFVIKDWTKVDDNYVSRALSEAYTKRLNFCDLYPSEKKLLGFYEENFT